MRNVIVAMGLVVGTRSAFAEAPFPHLPSAVAVQDVTASSTYADKANAYAAWRSLAYESRSVSMGVAPVVWSAWCEGKKDEGIGETVTITLAAPTQIDSIRIAAGVWRSDKLFTSNNQITSLDVIADGKSRTVVPKGKAWTEVKLGAKVTTLAFKIGAVKKGKMNDSCISGIELVAGGKPLAPVIGVDAKAVAALPVAMKEIQAALATPGKALESVIEFPFSNHDISRFFMGGSGSATKVANLAALVAACKTFAQKQADDAPDVDPGGCPQQAPDDPEDDRFASVTTVAPGTVVIGFTSHNEMGVTWRLRWKDRWRLQAIDHQGF